jgi:N-terminal acetyltransferase B complex non-catalytic subunit
MKIKKSLIPKREERFKKKVKPLTTNIDIINPEKMILNKIIQKDSSFKQLKEKIKKESNNNIHEILSSDESRLKAIKYVMNASKGKENQKNQINQINQNKKNNFKIKKNLSFGSNDIIPHPDSRKNKIKVKRSQKIINTKVETISPIKNENIKDNYNIEDKRLNNNALLRDNNIPVEKNIENYFYESPLVLLPRNKSYEITSHGEVNIRYIQRKDQIDSNYYNNIYRINNTQSNFYENNKSLFGEKNPGIPKMFYQKINNFKGNERNNSSLSEYNQYIYKTYDNSQNRTLNSFYIHKHIEKPMNNINKIKDNNYNNYDTNQEAKIFYENNNKNNSYDIKNNHKHKHYRNRNILQNFLKYNNSSYFLTDINNFYKTNCNYGSDYITIPNQFKNKYQNNINNNNLQELDTNDINNRYQQKIEKGGIIKIKNNSFFNNESLPMKNKEFNQKEFLEKDFSNELAHTIDFNNYNSNFSLHKKILANIKNYKGFITNCNNDNKENISNNKILVKKRPFKDSFNSDLINHNYKYKLCECSNINFNYVAENKDKIIFNNENEIIDYINKKFEENKKSYNDKKLKYTGFVLTKKYKGKILYELRIEDDINKINQKLKEEKVKIGDELIEIETSNNKEDLENLKNIIINLEKEIYKLKQENDSITNDYQLKNELITKMENEKLNIIKENEIIKKELEKMKKINEDLDKKINLNKNNNEIVNNVKNYKIENILKLNINNKSKNENENNIAEKDKIEMTKTPKIVEIINNLSMNLNGSNEEIEPEMKNPIPSSIFRLSKISEIKKIKNDIDSGDKELKTNLDLLNGEINPFNENE